jgi:acyl-CoA synthetase (AMP-forming)/AMP-acid ligase II/alkylation response protein AidB-like acyl-CoA dehydrogenase
MADPSQNVAAEGTSVPASVPAPIVTPTQEPPAHRPWFAHYSPSVPHQITVPDAPLTWLLDEAVRLHGDSVALEYYGATLTYAQLDMLATRFARALARLGVERGDRVSICLPNVPQFPIAFYGTLRAGAVAVPTNPLYTERELEHQLADSGAKIAITLDQLYPTLAAVRQRTPVEHVILTDPADYLPRVLGALFRLRESLAARGKASAEPRLPRQGRDIHQFKALLNAPRGHQTGEPADRVAPAAPDDVAVLQYTGGTTGLAKGAMLTHRNLLTNALQTWAWSEQSAAEPHISLCVAPFFHVYGLTVGMNLSIIAGARMVLLPRFTVNDTLKAIARYKPDLFPGVPTMYLALAREAEQRKADLRSVKVCISGSAPLPLEVQRRFEAVSPARVVEGYGLTEASPVTHCNPVFGDRRIGTIGLPLPNTESAIIDPQTWAFLPPGGHGEIVVRGPQVMAGYWNRPDETEQVLRDGWLRTGDLGYMNDDGYFTVEDRAKDLIIAGGFNVFPREVDEVLYTHPKVLEAAAVGVPDEYRGETVRAYIVVKPGEQVTAAELDAYCKAHLAAYKVPKQYEFREALPKTLVGKVLRRTLREEYIAAHQGSATAPGQSGGQTSGADTPVAHPPLNADEGVVGASDSHNEESEAHMATETTKTTTTETAAAFLTTPVTEEHFLTHEHLDEELRQVQEAATTFITREVLPKTEQIRHQEPGVMPGLLKLAGEQGLLGIDVPEEYGGIDLGLVASSLVGHEMREASFAVAYGADTTIGSLPIVFYGTNEQKHAYLPRLASGELIGAYALTEPGVGSDAMAIKTRATLSEDGQHYILNGAKQWISNAGFADVFIVFAKVDDTQHTAFIVEAAWPGISTGAEEKKVGIKGSSTRTVYFDNVKVPVANVLGEVGKGYKIAFNILNIGRLKLGLGAAGGAKAALNLAAQYSDERKAFGRPLHGFGMIKKKLAHMAADVYAAETLALRTVGDVEEARKAAGDDRMAQLKAIEEYAIECSMAKVYGSEALGRSTDEAVQIFGGYGFMEEYPISWAWRDARINRIFEGTNEVNRLVAAGTLFDRAMKGRISVMAAYPQIEAQIAAGETLNVATDEVPEALRDSVNLLERAKRAAIYTSLKGGMKFMATMREEQEFLDYTANQLITLFAMDSAVARALDAARSGDPAAHTHGLLAQLTVLRLLPETRAAIEGALTMTFTGDERAAEIAKVRGYLGEPQTEIVPLQREIAGIVAEKGGYPIQ